MTRILAQDDAARRIYWTMTFLVAAGIAFGVFAPRDPVPKFAHGQDSFEHFVAFGLFAGLVLAPQGRRLWRIVVLVQAIVLVELIQGYVIHTRNMQVSDALWGMAGVAAAGITLLAVKIAEEPLRRLLLRIAR